MLKPGDLAKKRDPSRVSLLAVCFWCRNGGGLVVARLRRAFYDIWCWRSRGGGSPTGLTGYHSIPFSSSLWRRAIRPVLISAVIVLFFSSCTVDWDSLLVFFFPSKPPDYSRHTHTADAVKKIYRSHPFPKPFISGSRLACHME